MNKIKVVRPFALGQVVATPAALAVIEASNQTPIEFLQRHKANDWGELDKEDIETNEIALRDGLRILSAYSTAQGEKIWIITEADRSATTILLPSDY